MSCGPGWVALQAPVVRLLGYPADMALIWAVSFAALSVALGADMAAGVLVLMCLAPSTWLALANGTDFLPFGVASIAIFASARRWGSRAALASVVALAACLVDQFRITTLLLPSLLATFTGEVLAGASVLLALAVELYFLFWNPSLFISDGPMHVLGKVVGLADVRAISTGAQSPWLLAALLVVPILLGFVLLRLALRYWIWERVTAACFALLFVGPALLDFRQKWISGTGPLNALQSWEGGMWMMAVVPLVALFAGSSAKRVQHQAQNAG